MKKVICIVLVLLFVFTSAIASEQRIYDNAGLFSIQQKNEIAEAIEHFRLETRTDFCVLTTDDFLGKNYHQIVGEWFYDSVSVGVGPSRDGLLYWIDMSEGMAYIVTTGDFLVRGALPDTKLDGIHECAYRFLAQGEYSQAVHAALNAIKAEIDTYLGK